MSVCSGKKSAEATPSSSKKTILFLLVNPRVPPVIQGQTDRTQRIPKEFLEFIQIVTDVLYFCGAMIINHMRRVQMRQTLLVVAPTKTEVSQLHIFL